MTTARPHIRLQSTRLRLPHGATLYDAAHPPSNLMFIASGFIKIGAADQVVFDYLGPGDVCGECCLEPGLAHQFARAATDVAIDSVSHARATSVLCRDPEFAAKVVSSLLRRLTRYESSITDFVSEPTGRRVARLLLRFQSPAHADGWAEVPNLTNPEIASTIGTTRWQVSRCLNRLQKLGIVRREQGFWVHLDRLRSFLSAGENAD